MRMRPMHKLQVTVVAAALVIVTIAATRPPAGAVDGRRDSARTPAINWTPCASGFECGTMLVPLDYDEPDGPRIQLALIRSHASDPASRIGSIVFNPGGPGGVGTEELPRLFSFFPVGLRDRFDLVSFDPRGIGNSTAVQCFDTQAEEEALFAEAPSGFPVGKQEEHQWIRTYRTFSKACGKRNGDLLQHISTADVARDMDQIRAALDEPKLRYIGLSYGTLLGATYANLFPQRAAALVLDGNVDPVAWFNGGNPKPLLGLSLRLRSDLGSADVLQQFLARCGALPTQQCAFSAGTPDATRAKFDELARRLRAHPIVLDTLPSVQFTYALMVKLTVDFLTTVAPVPPGDKPEFPGWTALANLLGELWQSSGSSGIASSSVLGPSAERNAVHTTAERYSGDNQGLAVACSEAPNPRRTSLYPLLAAFSFARAGDVGPFGVWSSDELCATWPAQADDAYRGPWNRPTAGTVLVIGNLHDPQTPYVAAQNMARLLARARLLTVNGYGHTAMLNPSDCANEAVTRYFVDGSLPPEGTVCSQTVQPFGR